MAYSEAFPDFPESDYPEIPAGFLNMSWKNDACPRFDNPDLGLTLWIDYLDPKAREVEGFGRFTLCATEQDDTETETINSDDYALILDAIEEERKLRK